MILTRKLQGIIVEHGITQRQLAKEIGINEQTFYRKMKRGVFDSDEITAMIRLLGISDPASIFFAEDGTSYVPSLEKSAISTKEAL